MNRTDLIGGVVPVLLAPDVAAYLCGCGVKKFNEVYAPRLVPRVSGRTLVYIREEVEDIARNAKIWQPSTPTLSTVQNTPTTLTHEDEEFVSRLKQKTRKRQSADLPLSSMRLTANG